MGISASSLLDETKSNYIRGQAEAELKDFSPYYRKQFSVARFSQMEEDLEQHKEKITQLLKEREAPEDGEVLYEEGVSYFDDTRKWRERYVVVRANYCLECHDSLETFVKGGPPCHKLLPTGGSVLTTEESYMTMVDKCFPDDTNVKEDFAPPLAGMPGQFPVYLRLPYRRDSYFCFRQQAKQDVFLSILSDCIRHQNQDFLKKKTCEVQAFLKAVQLYRQDKDKYEAWDMLMGSDVRVMANLVMEQLLPSLEKDMLPRLKAKKTERKRVWFATVEAAYILVQEHLLEGLSKLKEECRVSVRQQEVLIHSDMDQIFDSRRQLEEKVRAKVSVAAEKLCSESVQPYLGSILDELMEPVSSGFQEGRTLSENMMDQVCQDVQLGGANEQLKQVLANMARPNLLSCYQKISSLQEKLRHLQVRFGFSNIWGVIHSAQIDLQQLMENSAFTFEQLLHKAVQDNPDNAGAAIEKAKHRVLKQYDYDSSTVRKRTFQEALVSITLPFIKKNLADTCKPELQGLEQSVYADHSNFIHVENVYESVLLQTLDKEVTKVVKEAASLKKYNLFTDSKDVVNVSSRSSLSSPPVSSPGSPETALALHIDHSSEAQPTPPLVVNRLPSCPKTEEKEECVLQTETTADVTVIETPLGEVEQRVATSSVAVSQELTSPEPKAKDVVQAEQTEEADLTAQSETQEVNGVAEEIQATPEPKNTAITASQTPADVETMKSEAEEEASPDEAPNPSHDPEPVITSAEGPGGEMVGEPVTTSLEGPGGKTPDKPVTRSAEGPSCEVVVEPVTTSAEGPGAEMVGEPVTTSAENPGGEMVVEPVTTSAEGPSCEVVGEPATATAEGPGGETWCELSDQGAAPSGGEASALTVGGESPSSHVESLDNEQEVNSSRSPASSDDDNRTSLDKPSPQATTEPESGVVVAGGDIEAGAGLEEANTTTGPEASPLDCIKEIRELVVEVIEVEELVQHYPDGLLAEE